MPLRALLDDKEFFAWNLTESDRKKGYLCPICKTRFLVVLPKKEKRIKYFRHFSGTAHQENETIEHVNGKRLLIDIASKLGLKWHLEQPIGKHVTDVFIEGNQPLAIEFQCSKCDSSEILDRTDTYRQQGVAAFWILGAKFYKDFQKKTRTMIEREIEKLHPTVYLVNEKFSVCRPNTAYEKSVGYNKEYFGNVDRRLVEDFDIEWHLLNFIKTQLTEANQRLIFRWMLTEKPKPEPQPVLRIEQPAPVRQHYPKGVKTSQPIWVAKNIVTERKCDLCGKNNIEYVATLFVNPNPMLDKTKTSVERCYPCFIKLQKTFPHAIWKYT